MKTIKRVLALVLCAALLLALFAGCNKNQDADNKDGSNSGTGDKSGITPSKTGETEHPENVYRPNFTSFPGDFQWINTAMFTENLVYFSTEEAVGARRVFYDDEWNQLGYIEIDPSEVQSGDGPVTVFDNVAYAAAEDAEEEGEPGDEDVTAEDGEPTDEQGRRYCEELDLWYNYSSDEQVTEQVIYSMKLDCTDLKKLPDYKRTELPDGMNGYVYLNWFKVDTEGSLWISESGSMYHYDDNNQYVYDGEVRTIRKLSPTGAEVMSIDVDSLKGSEDYINFSSTVFDEDGNIYLMESNQNILFILNKEGKLTKKVELGERYINNLFNHDGQLYASYYGRDFDGQVMAPLDPATGTFGEEIKLPMSAYQLTTGGGDYSLYFSASSGIYGFDPATGDSENLVNWLDCDINEDNIRQYGVSEDGTIYAISQDYETGDGNMELIRFSLVPYSSLPQKTELSLACVSLDYQLRRAILKFNKTSDSYRIKLNDYSVFNTEDDYNAGTTKLATEIISGVVPDILYTQSLPINTYMKKGLIEDLMPYLQNDAVLKDDVLYEAFKPVMTEDGKLPIIASTFYIETLVGAAAVVGDEPYWTMKDLQTAMQNMPEGARAFSNSVTRSDLLQSLCRMTQSDYIDYENGKCHFDSDEFKSFLKFIASYPEEINWDDLYGEDYNWETDSDDAQVAAGKQMLYSCYLSDFWTYQNLQGIFLNKPFTFVGFPSSSGKGSMISYRIPIAMSTTCSDKEGAWSFMRTILLPDFDSWGLSCNKTRLMESFKEMSEPQYYYDENGKQVEQEPTQWIGGREIKVDRMTQANLDQILEVLDHCTAQTDIDGKILEIITEDTQAFFKGQKSVDEVCASIQSRITIYINENM